jgi:hypothetical protein
VGASGSTDRAGGGSGAPRRLNADERLALTGLSVIALSLLLPWWGPPGGGPPSMSGLGDFGAVEIALLLTVAATGLLLLRARAGYAPPRPLREWALVMAGGAWAAVIVGYRVFDRPDYTAGGTPVPYGLRLGIMIALGGALIVIAAALRLRERAARDRGGS